MSVLKDFIVYNCSLYYLIPEYCSFFNVSKRTPLLGKLICFRVRTKTGKASTYSARTRRSPEDHAMRNMGTGNIAPHILKFGAR
jgi:hypothetical protein